MEDSMYYSKIVGTGSYLPEKVVTNYDLEKVMDTSDAWIVERTGIKERRVVPQEGIGVSDLALEASKRALEAAHLPAEAIEMIIFATVTPDHILPSSASFLQAKLGAHRAAAFDLSAACSGFIYGLSIADQFIRTGRLKTILVVGAEVFSTTFINWKDRNTAIIFGDGAGACILQGSKEKGGVLSCHLFADGTSSDMLFVKAGGCVAPLTHERLERGEQFLQMRGQELFKMAIKCLCEGIQEVIAYNGYTLSDIDLFVPHQPNKRIIKLVAERLGLPLEKVFMNIHKYGNTSAASIPIALDEAVRQGVLKEGDLVLLAAFGGGVTWASALIRW